MSDIHWIKLKTSMFDDEKIRLIESMPEADTILIIWVRLLVLAGKTNDDGLIYIQPDMPYTMEMLATLFTKKINVVRLAIETLRKFNLIEMQENGTLVITNWEKHQNVDGMDKVKKLRAERNRRYRERKKLEQKEDVSQDASVTSRDATDTDSDTDTEEHTSLSSKDDLKGSIDFKKFIQWFNQKTGKRFKDVESNRKIIRTRIKEGYTKQDLALVTEFKVKQWKDDPKMNQYLRITTIFAPGHFANYLNEAQDIGQGNTSEPQDDTHLTAEQVREQAQQKREEFDRRYRAEHPEEFEGEENQ